MLGLLKKKKVGKLKVWFSHLNLQLISYRSYLNNILGSILGNDKANKEVIGSSQLQKIFVFCTNSLL